MLNFSIPSKLDSFFEHFRLISMSAESKEKKYSCWSSVAIEVIVRFVTSFVCSFLLNNFSKTDTIFLGHVVVTLLTTPPYSPY